MNNIGIIYWTWTRLWWSFTSVFFHLHCCWLVAGRTNIEHHPNPCKTTETNWSQPPKWVKIFLLFRGLELFKFAKVLRVLFVINTNSRDSGFMTWTLFLWTAKSIVGRRQEIATICCDKTDLVEKSDLAGKPVTSLFEPANRRKESWVDQKPKFFSSFHFLHFVFGESDRTKFMGSSWRTECQWVPQQPKNGWLSLSCCWATSRKCPKATTRSHWFALYFFSKLFRS